MLAVCFANAPRNLRRFSLLRIFCLRLYPHLYARGWGGGMKGRGTKREKMQSSKARTKMCERKGEKKSRRKKSTEKKGKIATKTVENSL